jgi:hypothetical protein
MHWCNDDLASRNLIYDVLIKGPDTPRSFWPESCFVGRPLDSSWFRYVNVHTVRHIVGGEKRDVERKAIS